MRVSSRFPVVQGDRFTLKRRQVEGKSVDPTVVPVIDLATALTRHVVVESRLH